MPLSGNPTTGCGGKNYSVCEARGPRAPHWPVLPDNRRRVHQIHHAGTHHGARATVRQPPPNPLATINIAVVVLEVIIYLFCVVSDLRRAAGTHGTPIRSCPRPSGHAPWLPPTIAAAAKLNELVGRWRPNVHGCERKCSAGGAERHHWPSLVHHPLRRLLDRKHAHVRSRKLCAEGATRQR